MALFEFRCRECDEVFEEIVIGDVTPCCPACKSPDLEKLLSTFAVGRGGGSRSTSTSVPIGGG